MRLQDFDTSERYTGTLRANRRLTDDIHELEFELDRAVRIEAGQSVGVILRGPFDDPGHLLPLGHDVHFRLYTVADLPGAGRFHICVQRCHYVDDYSGESYPGIASNFLCDLPAGASVTLCGPYGIPWKLPEDPGTDLVLVGAGTGAAPFRALLRSMASGGGWRGSILMLQLARAESGLVYVDELRDSFDQLRDARYDHRALTPEKPHLNDAVSFRSENLRHLLDVIESDDGCVFISGREALIARLDEVLAAQLSIDDSWPERKAAMIEALRWQQLTY